MTIDIAALVERLRAFGEMFGGTPDEAADLIVRQREEIERLRLDNERHKQMFRRALRREQQLMELAEAIADGEGDPQVMAQQTIAALAPDAPGQAMTAERSLPDVAPGHWTTTDGQMMATEYLGKQRGELCRGDLTDLELANAIFLASRNDLDLIVYQQAAKERIRWLSAQLVAMTAERSE